MKNTHQREIVIVGAGTAGIMLANKLSRKYSITLIDPAEEHYYQPGFLFVPFGKYKLKQLHKNVGSLVNNKVKRIKEKATKIDPIQKQVATLAGVVNYDVLVIATGTQIDPSQTDGLNGDEWRKTIFDFYTPDGAEALHHALSAFNEGTIAIQVTDMPIKCPVAPLEFAFLADDYFKKRGIRDAINIKFVTPLSGAFTKPVASEKLSHLLDERGIELVTDFFAEKIDGKEQKIICYDGREVDYNLLVNVPINVGAKFLKDSELVNDLGFVKVNKHSLQSEQYPDIFSVGDAADLPTSKAGSVAHFEVDTLVENIELHLDGQQPQESFDGHANCFVESGNGKALLLDFNYDTQPLEGTFPFSIIGPMKLLKPSRLNHIGKLAFRYIYWYMLLPGRKIPFIPAQMSMKGKKQVT